MSTTTTAGGTDRTEAPPGVGTPPILSTQNPTPDPMKETDPYLVAFGLAVKEARKKDGRTQAEAAYAVGISRTYFAQVENGQAPNVSLSLARRVADLFDPPVRLDPGPDPRPVLAELLQSHAARTYDTMSDERPSAEDVALVWRAKAVLNGRPAADRPPAEQTVDDLVAEMERYRRLARVSTDALIRALRAEREGIAAERQ